MFRGVCGYCYGAAGCWVRKEGVDELKDGVAVLKICITCLLAAACPVELAATTPETRRNPAVRPASPSMPHPRAYLRTPPHTQHANRESHQWCSGSEVEMEQGGSKSHLSSYERRPGRWRRRTPPARDARQDGQDGLGDGANEHRSRRVAHCRIVRQHIRLKIPGRSPADVAQLLLPQHLVLHRCDLDHLEKTPATTSLAASLSALSCAPPANTRRTREGGRKGILSAQPPD